MKRFYIFLLMFLLWIFVPGCNQEDQDPYSSSMESTASETAEMNEALMKGSASQTSYACKGFGHFEGIFQANNPDYGNFSYHLWAGKHNDAGKVYVTNDDILLISVNTNETADIGDIHVYVWESTTGIPTKRPAPGQGDYVFENINQDLFQFEIPKHTTCGKSFYISIHVALIENDTDNDESGTGSNAGETAYAGDAASPVCFDSQKGAWWGYITYTVTCYYDISGYIYLDSNSSGNMDAGETGLGGLMVSLMDINGNLLLTTRTNADGTYIFRHIPGGTDYTILSGIPVGTYTAFENSGGFHISDLSADHLNINFGFIPPSSSNGSNETAYAVGNRTFIDLGITNSRWGWQLTITGNTTVPIYAGAAQNNLSKGIHVGNLIVTFSGSTLTARFQMFPGFTMSETHLYVGDQNIKTISPGQYGNQHALTNATSDIYTINNVDKDKNGTVYLVAHAVVFCP